CGAPLGGRRLSLPVVDRLYTICGRFPSEPVQRRLAALRIAILVAAAVASGRPLVSQRPNSVQPPARFPRPPTEFARQHGAVARRRELSVAEIMAVEIYTSTRPLEFDFATWHSGAFSTRAPLVLVWTFRP